jgi:RNA polymerase sigma factor (sigma-70 family)
MATTDLRTFLRRLTNGMVAETLSDQSDRQLIEQFLDRRDVAVIETLVRRHGPMVYRVCWRVLQQEQDAEDAFQATFLLLAQKLRTVRKHDSLASWLHGVAHRVALKAKAQTAVRRRHEQQVSRSRSVPADDVTWKELRTVLDAELAQLPETWRLPLILFYLEGRTQEESAGQLGWSKSTLRRRLEEARDALGRRLTRRGIAWSAALSAVLLSDCIASASPACGLVASTIEATASVAAGNTLAIVAAAKVAALAEGVTNAMFLTKLKNVAFVLAAMVLLTAGVVSLAVIGHGTGLLGQEPGRRASPQEPGAPEAKAPDKDGDRLDGRHWVGVSAEVDGVTCRRSGQPGVPPPSYWDLKDGGCVKAQKERDEKYPNEVTFRFKYKLDAAAQPKAIDLIPEEGPARGKTLRGIYSLEGDELKICYVSPKTPEPEKKPRPDELAAKKDSGYVLLLFRDLDGIGRHWKGIAAEVDGAKVPPPPLWGFGRGGGGIGIRDEYRPQESPNEVVFFFKHKLDRATTPKSIDLIPQEGPAKGKTLRGIYSLEGDQLKICYVSPSIPEPEKKARPSEFAAKKGSGHVLLVFRVHSLVLDASVLDKAGFDKAELEWARGVFAAAREHDMTFTKGFQE